MKKTILYYAVASLSLSACSRVAVPLTCEGIASGIDLVIKSEKSINNNDLLIVKEIRDGVKPLCTSDSAQPTNSKLAVHIIEESARRLNRVLSKYSKEELSNEN